MPIGTAGGLEERPAESFENRLAHVVIVLARHFVDVDRKPAMNCEPGKEFAHSFRSHAADSIALEFDIEVALAPAADVHRYKYQRLVHRRMVAGVPHNRIAFEQRLTERLAENDAHILDCVVVIHTKIAVRAKPKIQVPMER